MTKNARSFAKKLAALCDQHHITLSELKAHEFNFQTNKTHWLVLNHHHVDEAKFRQKTTSLIFSNTNYTSIIGE